MGRQELVRVALAAAAFVAVAGCSVSEGGGGDAQTVRADVAASDGVANLDDEGAPGADTAPTEGVSDATAPDVAADTPVAVDPGEQADDASPHDGSEDDGGDQRDSDRGEDGDVVADGDAMAPCAPLDRDLHGRLGMACTAQEDCANGLCVDGRCAAACGDGCPCGFDCVAVGGLSLCRVAVRGGCETCTDDGPCGAGARCEIVDPDDLAAGGRCLPRCAGDGGPCPAGFTCRLRLTFPDAAGAWLCTPAGGEDCCLDDNEGATRPCTYDGGGAACAGVEVCDGNDGWGACGLPDDPRERCNGLDDDCDGLVDEDFGNLGEACDGDDGDACAEGELVCAADSDGVVCEGDGPGRVEACNGVDDDCDGETDEGTCDDGLPCTDDRCGGAGGCEAPVARGCLIDGACVEAFAPNPANLCEACRPETRREGWSARTGTSCADDDRCNGAEVCNAAGVCERGTPVDCGAFDGQCALGVCAAATGECRAEPRAEGEPCGSGDLCVVGSRCAAGVCAGGAAPDCDDSDRCTADRCVTGVGCRNEPIVPEPDGCDRDTDDDGVDNDVDNCPTVHNPNQVDLDGDGDGDRCDLDKDGDGHENRQDNCEFHPNPDQANLDGDDLGDACDDDDDGDGDDDDDDCAPRDATRYRGASEVCDAVDNDCDGEVDEDGADGCEAWFHDADGDGFGADGAGNVRCQCRADGLFRATVGGDCDDDDAAIHPEATERCNDLDDDCDDATDEAFSGLGEACDGPDHDRCANGTLGCSADGTTTACTGERPGDTVERCDGLDNDCDGDTDELFPDTDNDGDADCNDDDIDGDGVTDVDGADNCPYTPNADQVDTDEDGVGDACDGDRDGDGSADEDDCAPDDPTARPGAVERCNDRDDDCDGEIDETYPDKGEACDGPDSDQCTDGRRICNGFETVCSDSGVGVVERCNGRDDDCDGDIPADELDGDGDGWLPCEGDCDDGEGAINPRAVEACNGHDDDCDGETDEGFRDTEADGLADCVDPDDDDDGTDDGADNCPYLANPTQADADGDGVGDACEGDRDSDGTADDLDCAPEDPEIHRDADEICDDVDNDCDGQTDEIDAIGCLPQYPDDDRDGFGKNVTPTCFCGAQEGFAARPGDCCDRDELARPGMTSWFTSRNACDSWDYNCNGATDRQYTRAGGCSGVFFICFVDSGWSGATPGCGGSGAWVTGCDGITCSEETTSSRTQRCH